MGVLNTYVSSDYLRDIADAIREINGETTEYKPAEMPDEIKKLTLTEISIPESGDTWPYEGNEYVITENEDEEDGMRYLSRIVGGENGAYQDDIPLPEMITIRKKPAKRFFLVRKGNECNITLSKTGMEVWKIYGNGDPDISELFEAIPNEEIEISPATITRGGTHVITVSWVFMGISYTDTYTVDVLDENNYVMVTDVYLRNIASAIRAVTGKRRRFRASEMAPAIRSLRWKDDPNIVEKVPTRYPCLEITQLPNTVHYETYTGGTVELDYTGIIVSILSANGEREDVTERCSFFPEEGTVLTNSMVGLNTISVSCQAEDEYGSFMLGTSFEVNLAVEAGGPHGVPVKIKVNKRPLTHVFEIAKTATSVKLDYSGMIIKAVYKDGFTKTITKECVLDPPDKSTVREKDGTSSWTQKVQVEWFDKDTFRRFRTSFALTIKDNNPNSSTTTKTSSWTDPAKVTQTVTSVGTGTTYVVSTPKKKKTTKTPAKEDTVTDLRFAHYPVNLPISVNLPNTFKNYVAYPALVQAKINNRWKNLDYSNIVWKTDGNGVSGAWNLGYARMVTITATYKGRQCAHKIAIMGWGSYMNRFKYVLHLKVYEGWMSTNGAIDGATRKDLYDVYVCSMWPIYLTEDGAHYEINTSGSCTKALMREKGVPRGCGLRIPGSTISIGNSVAHSIGKKDGARIRTVYIKPDGSFYETDGKWYKSIADYLGSRRHLEEVKWVRRARRV